MRLGELRRRQIEFPFEPQPLDDVACPGGSVKSALSDASPVSSGLLPLDAEPQEVLDPAVGDLRPAAGRFAPSRPACRQ